VAASQTGQLTSQDHSRVDSVTQFPPRDTGNGDESRRRRNEIGHRLSEDEAGTLDAPIFQVVDEQPGRAVVEIRGCDAKPAVQ
jgi:hypothetical protein